MIVGCQKKVKKNETKASISIQELEAQFFDIPFPIDIINCSCCSMNHVNYYVSAVIGELTDFYDSNFEINGWKKGDNFLYENQAILIYKKPNKKVCLILKAHNNQVDVELYY